jgi:GntP family gluconate:H+ symporter
VSPFVLLFLGMAVVVGGILVLRLHAFLALLLGALIVGAATPEASLRSYARSSKMTPDAEEKLVAEPLGQRLARRFGSTCAQIGILIAMASIIGKCLLESGAADRIVRSSLRALGERRAGLSFLGSGFLLGIPVFFDTVFFLMVPLGKAMGLRTGRNYLLYILTIAGGATMAHSLVPPTPGPLFVAGQLRVNVGEMIIGGCAVGIFTSLIGYAWASFANRRWQVPLRETADISLAELEAISRREDRDLPPLWLSLLPVLLPVALIGGKTVLDPDAAGSSGAVSNLALILGAAIALILLARHGARQPGGLGRAVESALSSGGIIILITAAGGAFGGMLQETGIGASLAELMAGSRLAVLPLAFLVTSLVRTAQGSATVAMITAAGILSGLSDPAQLGFHPVYLALAIGCGSKPIHWMNDSGFWVITRMSGLTEAEALKTVTPMTAIMGVAGLLATMAGAAWLPMV